MMTWGSPFSVNLRIELADDLTYSRQDRQWITVCSNVQGHAGFAVLPQRCVEDRSRVAFGRAEIHGVGNDPDHFGRSGA